jgi:predicted nicotinamide N-methyase
MQAAVYKFRSKGGVSIFFSYFRQIAKKASYLRCPKIGDLMLSDVNLNESKGMDRYETKWINIQVADKSLAIRQLADFEKTVDQLIDQLAAQGQNDITPEDCPYFGQVWISARRLAAIVRDLDLKGKQTLEVGCGLALPSMVAASCGADATAMDLHRDVGSFIATNCAANDISIGYLQADWRVYSPDHVYDYIFGSDILYENAHPLEVCAFLQRSLKADGGVAIIVDPCRWHHKDFADLLAKEGFRVESVYSDEIEDGKPVRLFTLKIRKS